MTAYEPLPRCSVPIGVYIRHKITGSALSPFATRHALPPAVCFFDRVRPWLSFIALISLIALGSTRVIPVVAAAESPLIDSHFHIGNYAMQGVGLKNLIDHYMGDRVQRSVVFGLPLQQKWDRFEHYADDRMPPNYYLGPRAGLYYYSLIDAMVAMDYQRLSPGDQARLDPMIVGFNPMDQYGTQHVQRLLLMFPGVFVGIGEFSIHKEIVEEKINDDRIDAIRSAVPAPLDVSEKGHNSLYSPALETLLDFAGEAGLIVTMHNDIYAAEMLPDGRDVRLSPDRPYTEGMKTLCRQSPETRLIWAHTGLGRFVKPVANHLDLVSEILDACPNWSVDLSWDLVQSYIVHPDPGMPTLADWSRFVSRYQDRVLWGSDTVIFTKNRVDDRGVIISGAPMPAADYQAVTEITEPLWNAVGAEVARKVRGGNHTRLFDEARSRVRAWEAANAALDVWNLAPPRENTRDRVSTP